MKRILLYLFPVLFFYNINLNAQPGNYYDSVNPESASFITDLKTLIRTGYTIVSYNLYDETMITNFESRDTTGGQRAVDCFYSGFIQVYTPPFQWTPVTKLSREHVWPQSWMPTSSSTTTAEYADQHHLFPAHQDYANSIRDNLPLDNVVTANYTFLEGKRGTDAYGRLVYEPRNGSKGDAARALLYMSVRYDGISGNSWTFDWLNLTRLPEIEIDSQSVQTLLQWHRQDPPDRWEVERNDYIQNSAAQNNRNPFVDHPEYVNYIKFYDLTKYSPTYATEPTNYVTGFTCNKISNGVTVNWNDAVSGTLPTGYLLLAYNRDNYFIPIDGEVYPDDTDLSNGVAVVNIGYAQPDIYTFTGLDTSNTYYFTMYSYNGNASLRNYKINGDVPRINTITSGSGVFTDLIISEYVEGSSYNKAIEIYNGTVSAIDLGASGYKINIYYNGSSTATTSISLTGTLQSGDVFVIANSSASEAILSVADQFSGSLDFNGDDAVALMKGSAFVDVIGQVGFDPGTQWGSDLTSTADNTIRRKATVTTGDTNPFDVFDPAIEWVGYAIDTFDGLGSSVPLPVELSSFTAEVVGSVVILRWRTETELNNYGFEIERNTPLNPLSRGEAEGRGVWENIGFVNGYGNSNSPKDYIFTDNEINSGKYSYRLKQIDNDGSFEYSKVIEIDIGFPTDFMLGQNYPNPFNPLTVIGYKLPFASLVTLKLYDVLGSEVAALVNTEQPAGNYELIFDASSSAGGLSSGVYFYILRAGNFVEVKKMILLR